MSKTVPTADEARHRLYEIMKQEGAFESKAREALELGTEYLAVDSGFVTRVDRDSDYWETIATTDDDEGLVPTGATQNLSGTHCRHTLERDSPLAVHDIPNSDELEEDGGFRCYHGTTLTVDGEPYGTVCFVARDARDQQFDEAETMFAELVARLLEHELEHRRQQEELARQTSMINVLDRVLRHNIRNDTTVIRAMGEILAEQREDCEQCAMIVEKTDEIIAMSETARHLGKLINEGGDRQPIDLASLTRNAVAEASENYPEMTITADLPDRLVVSALPALETAVWELLENAAKHAGSSPTVTVRVTETTDCIEITVSDDGPGIPQTEKDVLQTGTETQLIHGSGLGLWSVYWIVINHNGEIDISTRDGTTIRISLPPDVDQPEQHFQVRRAADRFRSTFEDAPIGLLLLDDDGWIVEANDQIDELLDHPHRITGHKLAEFCTDEVGLLSEVDTGEIQHGEIHLRSATADEQPMEYTVIDDVVPGQHLVVVEEVGR